MLTEMSYLCYVMLSTMTYEVTPLQSKNGEIGRFNRYLLAESF